MTATLHKLGAGMSAGLYYTNDSAREARPDRRDEYYVGDGGGIWWSSGESVVRHGAAIDRNSFRDLCAGRDPRTAKALVRGAGEGHWAGLDMTLTPGKSVSILWAAGTKEQRAMIEAAHDAAVDRALRFVVDENLVVVRQGAGGAEKSPPTDLIVGRFNHFTTRAGDPNIHSHCVFMNVAGAPTNGGSERHKTAHLTIEPEKLFVAHKCVGAAYRATLAEQLAQHGLTPRPAGRGQWELTGIDQPLIERFSKRSHDIEAAVGRDASAAQKEIAALRTRQGKEELPTGEELERQWRYELVQAGSDPWVSARDPATEHAPDINRADERDHDPVLDPPEIPGPQALAIAASHLFRHESVLDRRRLLEESLIEGALQSLGPDEIYRQIAALEAKRALIRLSPEAWTTPSVAAAEAAMLRAAERPQEREWFTPQALEAALRARLICLISSGRPSWKPRARTASRSLRRAPEPARPPWRARSSMPGGDRTSRSSDSRQVGSRRTNSPNPPASSAPRSRSGGMTI